MKGESVDGRELWPSWWVNTSGSTTGMVLFDRWVCKAMLGWGFCMRNKLNEAVGAGIWDFTAADQSVLRTVVLFWRWFAVICTPAARLDFQKFQARRQYILAAADVGDTDGFDGVWGAGPYCVWHSSLVGRRGSECRAPTTSTSGIV